MSPNGRLKGPAVETLQYFMQQYVYLAQLKTYYKNAGFSAEQKELLIKSGLTL